jgi:hypothetical protein
VVSRPDLADRALFLTLPYLSEAQRWPEQKLWQEFDLARPRLLGALLDVLSHGLRAVPGAPRSTATDGRFRALGGGMRNRPVARRHLRARHAANRRAAIADAVDADRWPPACAS